MLTAQESPEPKSFQLMPESMDDADTALSGSAFPDFCGGNWKASATVYCVLTDS